MPVTTAGDRIFGTTYYTSIAVTTEKTEDLSPTKERLEKMMDGYFSITNTNERPFTISNQEDILSTVSQITGTFKLFLGAVAAISLVV